MTLPSPTCVIPHGFHRYHVESVKIILQGVPLWQQSRGRPEGPQSRPAAIFEGKLTCVAVRSSAQRGASHCAVRVQA